MHTRGFRVQGLGEIAIRCADLESMARFYEDIIGLEPLPRGNHGSIRFYRIAHRVAGHTAVLALFQCHKDNMETLHEGIAQQTSSLHHIALSLPREEQDAVIAWYQKHGIMWRVEEFPWIGWRGVFTQDPEGNTVELVAFDPALKNVASAT